MSDYDLSCPLPGCGEPLYIEWSASYGLSPQDLTDGLNPQGMTSDIAHVTSWQVTCQNGHVVLVPGDPSCPCEDSEGPDCHCNQDDYDHSDEYRTFRPHDTRRLAYLIETLVSA